MVAGEVSLMVEHDGERVLGCQTPRQRSAYALDVGAMDIALSLLVLTTIALVLGAAFLWRRPGYRRQAALMLVLAVVMMGNIVIWTLPTKEGATLSGGAKRD